MDYTEIAVWVPLPMAEEIAWHLQEWGVAGVIVSQVPAEGPRPESVAVKFYRPGEQATHADYVTELAGKLGELAAFYPAFAPRVETRLVPEEDWADSWKRHWHAQEIGDRLVVKPSWEPFTPKPGQLVIELDPKQAFGTGTHPTTQLCMRGLEAVMPRHEAPLVFDVGTGSGILAVAAVLLGARHVEACDTDPVATLAAQENADINGVADRVALHTGPIETISGQADVLVVNILAEVIAEIAAEIAARVRPGGDVLASGIIRERQALVERAFTAVGLRCTGAEYQGEWVLLTALKP